MKPDLSRYETDWPAHVVSAALESRDGPRSRRYPTERGDHPRRDDATTIHLVRRFGSTPSTVFNAWTDPALAGQWLFATASRPMARVCIDARVGGRFRLTEPRDTGT